MYTYLFIYIYMYVIYIYIYDILMYTSLECVFLSFEPYPNVLDSVAETGGCFKGGD